MVAARLRRLLLASCSSLALAFVAGRAEAVTITVSYNYSLSGGPLVSNTQSDPNSVDFLPSDSDSSGSSIFGHDYGYANGVFGTRSSGNGNFTKDGSSLWSDVITNTWGGPVAIVASFLIDNGQVGMSMNSATGSFAAGVGAEIKVDGNVLFTSSADMTMTDGGTPVFTTAGTVLNPGGESLSPGFGNYNWNAYSGSLYLGLLEADESISVEYLLTSYATGSLPGCSSGGYGGYGYGGGEFGDSCNLGQSIGRIGDPVNIGGDGGQFDVQTPEPASAAMLGAGLAALAFRRRRRA